MNFVLYNNNPWKVWEKYEVLDELNALNGFVFHFVHYNTKFEP